MNAWSRDAASALRAALMPFEVDELRASHLACQHATDSAGFVAQHLRVKGRAHDHPKPAKPHAERARTLWGRSTKCPSNCVAGHLVLRPRSVRVCFCVRRAPKEAFGEIVLQIASFPNRYKSDSLTRIRSMLKMLRSLHFAQEKSARPPLPHRAISENSQSVT